MNLKPGETYVFKFKLNANRETLEITSFSVVDWVVRENHVDYLRFHPRRTTSTEEVKMNCRSQSKNAFMALFPESCSFNIVVTAIKCLE